MHFSILFDFALTFTLSLLLTVKGVHFCSFLFLLLSPWMHSLVAMNCIEQRWEPSAKFFEKEWANFTLNVTLLPWVTVGGGIIFWPASNEESH